MIVTDLTRSGLVLLLAGIAAIVFTWLYLSAGNKRSSVPLNSPRKPLAFRISNIPRRVDKDEFRDILTRLPIKAEGAASQLKWTLLGFSYTPSAALGQADRYTVATATFANAPTLGELETAIKREIGIDASRLKVDLDFFGLTPLADPVHDIAVDIIAVTGLAGHAFGSWKAKKEPDMWLRDFLPEAVPNARILTYGYDTKLPGSQSEASIPDLSRRLLESIKTIRSGHTKNRPLMLIGHSLGGLVVKEALAEASEGSKDDQAVFRSCYAVLLFAVPNRGLENSSLMYMVKGQPNEDLVKDLKQSSRFLNMLSQRFNKYFTLEDSEIISIYETRMTPTVKWCSETASWERTGSKIMMVPFTSAIHAGPNEKVYNQIPIEANHSEIIKFSDTSNHDYLIIESRIRELVAKAPEVIHERFAKLKRKFSVSETRYIEALQAPDYSAFRNDKVDKPTPGTLGWFLKSESVQSWLATSEPSALWVYGSPGQGKTILAKFLLDYLDFSSKSNPRTPVIYFFFYNQDDNYQTIRAALRSFIKQLLSVPNAFRFVSDKFNLETSTITEESMWAILEELLHSSIFDTVYCVIDALDECQDLDARQRFLGLIEALVQPPLARRIGKSATFKAFLTSRPTVDLGRSLKQFPSIQLKANPDDLKVFILGKIQIIGLPSELESRAVDLLSSRAEQTFLWISIILKKLKTVTTLLSEADMEQIINESPSDLTDLYESIISQIMQSDDKATQKLLVWTVFGRRALTLKELDDALAIQEDSRSIESIRKYRIQDFTESKITSAAGIILEIIGGKVYLIHQSAKDFLLKSEHLANAAFCRGLRPGVYLARTCMAYLCFTNFVETGPCQDSTQLEERIHRHPFFLYAARNWHRHFKIDDDINMLTSIISQLTKPGSPELLAWGEAAGIADLDEAENAWDIATKANIPWLTEFHARGQTITEHMINEAASRGLAGYNFMKTLTGKSGVYFTEEAACATARYFDSTIMRQLLDKNAGIIITPALIEAAAANQKYGRLVMDLLLDLLPESPESFMITTELVQLAAENHESGRDIIELLLHKEDMNISEGAMAEIAASFDTEIMRTLMNSREDLKVTETVFEAAMGRKSNIEKMVIILLEQQVEDLQIKEEFIQTIARKFNKKAMELVLEKLDRNFQITEEVVKAAAKNSRSGKGVIKLLLDRRGDQIPITEEVVKAAVENSRDGKGVIKLLLDRRGDQIPITEEVVKAAVESSRDGKGVIKLLLDRRGDQIPITEEIVIAAARKSRDGKGVIKLLLDRRGDQIPITEEVIIAAARNLWDGWQIMALLLNERGDQISITEEVVIAAAGNSGVGWLIMELLLEEQGDQITITEEVVKAAAKSSEDVMTVLLDQRGDQISIIEEVVIAAAGNLENGEEMMKLLLDRRGDQISITEEVVKVAAKSSKEILTLLLKQRGDQISITEEVVIAAAGNSRDGWEIMELLLDRRGDQIPVTEEVMKAVVGNRDGNDIMELLLNHRRGEIIITKEVIKVAARNSDKGKEIITSLFDQRDDITITKEAVKALLKYKKAYITHVS